ncbi:MAG: immunoglobulin domain-containing protein [bacterium]|nr:immunoglobulin domain-containing protein [bacterium]
MHLRPPHNQLMQLGTSASFSVANDGVTPYFYRWYHQGAPIADVTAAVLNIANVQQSHTGMYHLVVSNFYGTATSKAAELSIIPEPTRITGFVLAGTWWMRRP